MHSWSENGYTLVFISRASAAGNSGFYLLSVPAERIAPGRPLELRVEGSGGDPAAWFMIKDYRDTLALRARHRRRWRSRQRAAPGATGRWRSSRRSDE